MAYDFLQTTSALTASLSSLAAIFSGACAFLSYMLATKIRDELKSDERIIAGVPIHPDLCERAHSESVIQCTLFNKSKRKAFLSSVLAFDRKGGKIDVTWTDKVDPCGNPQDPCQLVGIVDSCPLFVRRNDGKAFDYARLAILHSFSSSPMTLIFDPLSGWEAD